MQIKKGYTKKNIRSVYLPTEKKSPYRVNIIYIIEFVFNIYIYKYIENPHPTDKLTKQNIYIFKIYSMKRLIHILNSSFFLSLSKKKVSEFVNGMKKQEKVFGLEVCTHRTCANYTF